MLIDGQRTAASLLSFCCAMAYLANYAVDETVSKIEINALLIMLPTMT